MSKIVEKAVLFQLFKHCEGNASLPNLQSGFRRFHPVETALLKVQTDVLMSMDRQEITLLALLILELLVLPKNGLRLAYYLSKNNLFSLTIAHLMTFT